MRIKRLELQAFGPFTGKVLDFAPSGPGLHLVYGPNEAGKSSSLRGLQTLLYGFPERTGDNFLHANDQLLVSGTLEKEDGRELSFLRRKKRKADLLDSEGNPLEPGVLAAFLQGIEPEIFRTLYGIDHQTLVRGGEDILAQKGELGQALFAAGAGISSLRAMLDDLETEAELLFKIRGTKQEINRLVAEYRQQQNAVKQASLSVREWQEHRQALENDRRELARLEAERQEKDRQRRHLERLRRALPHLGLRRRLEQQLQALGPVKVLPPDFGEQRQEIEQAVLLARQQLQKATARLQELGQQQEQIALYPPILDRAESVENLLTGLGGFRKGREDGARLDGMRIAARREAAELLRGLRPDLTLEEIELLRPALAGRRKVLALAARHEALVQKITQAGELLRDTEAGLQAAEQELELLPPDRDGADLLQAVKLARREGEIDREIQAREQEVLHEQEESTIVLDRLGLWQGGLAALVRAPLPLSETVRRFDEDFQALAERNRQLERDRLQLEQELQAAEGEHKLMESTGKVPREEDLCAAREKREAGWQLLRRRWLAQEDVEAESTVYDSARELPAAYEHWVRLVDELADRLRREADRVAGFASLCVQKKTLQQALAEIRLQEKEQEEKRVLVTAEWRKLWQPAGIEPLPPQEMLAWLTGVEKLSFRVAEYSKKEREIEEKRKKRQELQHSLQKELRQLGLANKNEAVELAPLLVQAETLLQRISEEQRRREDLEGKRRELRQQLARHRERLAGVEAEMTEWRAQWEAVLGPLNLGYRLEPGEAADLFDRLQECFATLKEAEDFRKRIQGIERDGAFFAREAAELVQQVAPELQGMTPERAVAKLQERLAQARRARVLQEKYEEEEERLREEIREADAALHTLDGRMAALLCTAGCAGAEGLDEIIRRSGEWQELTTKRAGVEETLAGIAEGIGVEELEEQAAGLNPDELPGEIEILAVEIEEKLNPEVRRLLQGIGREEMLLQQMDGRGEAAAAAEAAEQILARLRRLSGRYLRLKCAAGLLRQEMERYRSEHQDPILKIASEYFRGLTLSSFAGLRTDVNDQGQPILVGLRPDQTRLPVEAMSSGTRDQLYLSLRLATLYWRLQNGEPMPFIVDDILINFDDERSGATLKVLQGLAAKTQVILFTHHRRIVEQAACLDNGSGLIRLHELAEEGQEKSLPPAASQTKLWQN